MTPSAYSDHASYRSYWKACPQWVVWRLVCREGPRTQVPFDTVTLRPADGMTYGEMTIAKALGRLACQ